MVQLVERATTIYFRLPDDIGIHHSQLKQFVELENRPYSDAATERLETIKKEIHELSESLKNTDLTDPICQDTRDSFGEKINELEELRIKLRPYGRGVSFDIESQNKDKLGWFRYYKSETLTNEEVDFIKGYIRNTLASDEVIIEVEYYNIEDDFGTLENL